MGERTSTNHLSGPRQDQSGEFWLKDESLGDSYNLPQPDVMAHKIVEDLQAALDRFKLIAGDQPCA